MWVNSKNLYILYILIINKTGKINIEEYHYKTIEELSLLIKNKKLSPVEITENILKRISLIGLFKSETNFSSKGTDKLTTMVRNCIEIKKMNKSCSIDFTKA